MRGTVTAGGIDRLGNHHAIGTDKRLTDWHCNTMVQHALAKFVAEGSLLRHIRDNGKLTAALSADASAVDKLFTNGGAGLADQLATKTAPADVSQQHDRQGNQRHHPGYGQR